MSSVWVIESNGIPWRCPVSGYSDRTRTLMHDTEKQAKIQLKRQLRYTANRDGRKKALNLCVVEYARVGDE